MECTSRKARALISGQACSPTSRTAEIRWLIYTTNAVEGYHRQVRKVTKTKGVFASDDSLVKLVYLAYRNIRKKWTMPLANWFLIAQQLCIRFEDRFKILIRNQTTDDDTV